MHIPASSPNLAKLAYGLGLSMLGLHFGLATAQVTESDPQFHATVVRPTHTREHPRVAIDQAHHNLHTLHGRYHPFADLLTSDGYEVVPNDAPFDAHSLHSFRVLVIANARGGETPSEVAQRMTPWHSLPRQRVPPAKSRPVSLRAPTLVEHKA
jgi:hypothetical protein